MKNVNRLNFGISVDARATLKAACAETMILMKDFLHRLNEVIAYE